MVDAAGAVTLDIAVTANGARARTLPADIASQEKHADYFGNGINAELLLANTKAPADDARRCLAIDFGSGPDLTFG
jgi:hypothetical protein